MKHHQQGAYTIKPLQLLLLSHRTKLERLLTTVTSTLAGNAGAYQSGAPSGTQPYCLTPSLAPKYLD